MSAQAGAEVAAPNGGDRAGTAGGDDGECA